MSTRSREVDVNGECRCNLGYKGETCDRCNNGFIKINNICQECPGSYGGKYKECSNKGTCINENNKAMCKCNNGWKGYTCLQKDNTKNSVNCLEFNNLAVTTKSTILKPLDKFFESMFKIGKSSPIDLSSKIF